MTESVSATYAVLIENCEWEGETWRFYIPIKGNEDALKKLDEATVRLGDSITIGDDPFELDLTPIPESEVDTLVKHGGDTDYMAAHNKLEGVLVIPDAALTELAGGSIDPLDKGRISDYMKATAG